MRSRKTLENKKCRKLFKEIIMQFLFQKYYLILIINTLSLFLCVVSGCTSSVGPSYISMSRSVYNEVINRTEDEQMLLSIVKGRYGETSSQLAVSAIAANVNFKTNAGLEAGFGSKDNYRENLVPFSGGFAFEENPTITYMPIQGEQYMKQLMSPISLDILVLVIRSGAQSTTFFNLLVKRVNDMLNPDFFEGPFVEPDPKFQRFVELNKELDQAGVMQWVEDPREDVPYAILITSYAPKYSQEVREYLGLLGIPMPTDDSEDIVLPVYFAVKGSEWNGIAISTRSTFEVLQILRASIEIPQEHQQEGLVMNYPTLGPPGKDIHVHSSKKKPQSATVAVKHRKYWFYIDESDMKTKLFYMALRTLWSTSITGVAGQRTAPVLTIPVSN
jgi:hypothetical protein